MKKSVLVLLFALLALPAVAQDDETPIADISAGYSHLFFTDGDINSPGWNSSFSYNFTPNFALTGEIGGHYENISGLKLSQHTFLVGPKVTARTGKLNPFAQALFGGGRLGYDAATFCIAVVGVPCPGTSGTVSGFAMAVGGGLDYRFHRNASIRIAQVDWVHGRYEGEGVNQARITFGVVLHIHRQ